MMLGHHLRRAAPAVRVLPAASYGALRFLSTDAPEKLFDKLLIANRGEIACRVIKTCKKLGIETVAVHSDADADALHTRMADEKVLIGTAQSSDSYLRMDRILKAIKLTGAQAVHPGYGFLSENKAFAQLLEDNGIAFVGPGTHAIEVMGDKIASKKIAEDAGVNIIPGFSGVVQGPDHAIQLAQEIGYPVMIKASAGGGGKGMRVAWNDAEVRAGYRLSSQEAKASFGDDRLLIEKYIDKPRHIEIQVLADSHGNAIYLNERECSIQRRNQKVIEEAPSTFLNEETRRAMGEQACALARAVDYKSAGTVEFLVDSQRNFYFCEMNTRLQVEHPVTELITGVDLVEQMIRVAAGLPLTLKQSDIGIKGWAFESRVYAEDPVKYLPSTGHLHRYIEPTNLPGVRVDTGIFEGSEISMFYDPMISKLITYGKDRNEALQRMGDALDHYVIRGVKHNIPLLRDVIEQPRFVSGDISTSFLQETYPDGFPGYQLSQKQRHSLVAVAAYLHMSRCLGDQEYIKDDVSPAMPFYAGKVCVTLGGEVFTIEQSDEDFRYTAVFEGGETIELANVEYDAPVLRASANDEPITVQLVSQDPHKVHLSYVGTDFEVVVRTQEEQRCFEILPEKKTQKMDNFVATPMPGTLISLNVKEGDTVFEGQEIAIVEAMKMQNQLLAPRAGKIKKVYVKPGETLDDGELIVELEDEATAAEQDK
ncbi:uncharacterized protein MONBRDRAFT_17922 [Monosiga brevicollis MX1]|uniref:Propionyl-CoA carboxylase alpha chain, mitochondrial n=1 Tax=Monosiga brevicollis TaxID=81824 RepID=A9UT75_MONBE|nr:uncharacterized protein MONBRDRAFT_17922 [Monosiga brevicollis MX1]EDQ91197.1 predicted protein [Monosiga brevicollis MX1]|eukprot:XP_001743619.1 hypothetical protein [Monosiga brevicollis MX1]